MFTFGINECVENRSANSPNSHYEGTLGELVFLAANDWASAEPMLDADGNETGVWVYNVKDLSRFYTGIVPIGPDSVLKTTVEAREGIVEAAWKKTVALCRKTLGVSAVLGFYSHEILAKKNENSTSNDFELVFYNVEPTMQRSPLSPENMARNFLNLDGGTKQNYTAQQFAESIAFWAVHARIEPQ